MLILSRRCNETIVIDGQIHIQVLSTSGGRVKLGVQAPQEVVIRRSELLEGPGCEGVHFDCDPALVSEPEPIAS